MNCDNRDFIAFKGKNGSTRYIRASCISAVTTMEGTTYVYLQGDTTPFETKQLHADEVMELIKKAKP